MFNSINNMHSEDENIEETEFVRDIETLKDFDDVDETEGNASLRIQKLKEDLKKCAGERKDYLEGWQRAKADYLNSKKRFDEEKSQTRAYAQISFIEDLLPLCDSFDMALEHGDKSNASGDAILKTGLTLIHGQLNSFLAKYNISEVRALGEVFNPHEHEALSSQSVDNPKLHDTIVTVLQKGYKQGDKLIRPAKVVIGTHE